MFELTIEGDECTASKVVDLDKPTALAFDKDGHMYVTIIGTKEEGSKKPAARLWAAGIEYRSHGECGKLHGGRSDRLALRGGQRNQALVG